jgi:hypothetical protein
LFVGEGEKRPICADRGDLRWIALSTPLTQKRWVGVLSLDMERSGDQEKERGSDSLAERAFTDKHSGHRSSAGKASSAGGWIEVAHTIDESRDVHRLANRYDGIVSYV